MSEPKRAAQKRQRGPEAGPRASRPHMPGYGLPKSKKGLLPWSHVTGRMEQAQSYWICTVDPDGHPHATPVDGLWLDEALYFGGYPTTRRNRNLEHNPAVCVHLDGSTDVVILHGEAHELRQPDPSLANRLAEASAKKYGYAPKPEEYFAGGSYVFRPRQAFAWKQALKNATRWTITES